MLKIVAIVCLVTCATAGPTLRRPRLDGRVIGGSDTGIASHPYQVSLQWGGSHTCGGSILNEKWILTAAHCVVRASSYYTIRVGTSVRGSGGIVHEVSSITQHARYDPSTFDYDIAVIKIMDTFTFTDNVRPVSLAADGFVPADGAISAVTGWGTTSTGASATTLQVVEVPIVSNERCDEFYSDEIISDRMVCAGYVQGGKDACQGDSGGPLVSEGVQVGIVSWGYGCALPAYPGVYASVGNLRNWIALTTGA